MQPNVLAPLLTERDPIESAEGGLDPLGSEPLADALAVRLVSGVRERQRHPRFLTAIAVSLEVCGDFDEDTIAGDSVSEPAPVIAATDFRRSKIGGLRSSPVPAARLPLSKS